ncbi:MAG: FAD-dependent oxidoreductase [Planctomycetota bacterium]
MADNNDEQRGLSRRELIELTGCGAVLIGAGGAAGSSMISSSMQGIEGDKPARVRRDSRLTRTNRLETDIVVVGGGMAGVCASIAAARNGASVVLVQDRPVLGGNASSEIRMHICGADRSGGRGDTDARETGIIEELRLEEAMGNPQRSVSMWDLLLYDWIKREPNITLLLNTHCYGIKMSTNNRIDSVLASRYSTEDLVTIGGKLFIDCSGDGRLGAEAGADFRMGREGRNEFGESLAPQQADNKTMGSSILFVANEHDRSMPFRPPGWIHEFKSCSQLPYRSHSSWEYGYWWVEWGGEMDTIKDNESIRDNLLAYALGVWDHIKNSGRHPASDNWALEWLGFLPCKRESRRFIGDYILKQQDVEGGRHFADGVAFGGWSIDLHPPGGIDSKERPANQVKVPLYNIPFRSLYSRNIDNLLFAGRNISATHVAFGSTRVMATCSVLGQAVGTAAALCIREKYLPRKLFYDAIGQLQQQLLKDDAYIIGLSSSDSADLARTAEVRASSERTGAPATNIINGIHRGVYKQSNRWISDPQQKLPQWIELRFRQPARLREVHLTFDTGLNRPLTLTNNNRFNTRMTRGPQPETVKDYELQAVSGNNINSIAKVKGNYQRKRIHGFDPLMVDGIRIVIQATNGDASARLFEVRAYS